MKTSGGKYTRRRCWQAGDRFIEQVAIIADAYRFRADAVLLSRSVREVSQPRRTQDRLNCCATVRNSVMFGGLTARDAKELAFRTGEEVHSAAGGLFPWSWELTPTLKRQLRGICSAGHGNRLA